MATKKTTAAPTTPVEETVTVRLYVAFNGEDVCAFGRSGWTDEDLRHNVEDYECYEGGVFVELELPKPKARVLKAQIVG